MTTAELSVAVAAAILVFWLVGAYNRMVALRNALGARFAQVAELMRRRAALLDQQIVTIAATMAHAAPRLESLRAACRQVETAREQALARRGRAAAALTSLRLAETILAEARARLPATAAAAVASAAPVGSGDAPDVHAQLVSNDATLVVARREFNSAATLYNEAVAQFPTLLVAKIFGFRTAATL